MYSSIQQELLNSVGQAHTSTERKQETNTNKFSNFEDKSTTHIDIPQGTMHSMPKQMGPVRHN